MADDVLGSEEVRLDYPEEEHRSAVQRIRCRGPQPNSPLENAAPPRRQERAGDDDDSDALGNRANKETSKRTAEEERTAVPTSAEINSANETVEILQDCPTRRSVLHRFSPERFRRRHLLLNLSKTRS